MYKIGELSKLCNIPVKTLRYYDSEGILCPDEIDTSTGYRYYSAARLSDCYRILALKELGFTLEEIRAGQDMPRQELADLLAAKSRELSALLDRTQQHIATLRRLSAALEEKKICIILLSVKAKKYESPLSGCCWLNRQRAAGHWPNCGSSCRRIFSAAESS